MKIILGGTAGLLVFVIVTLIGLAYWGGDEGLSGSSKYGDS